MAIEPHLDKPAFDSAELRALHQQRKTIEHSIAKADQKQLTARERLETAQNALQGTCDKVSQYQEESQRLAEKRDILAHDVELDSLFNVFKVGLTLLVTYVLRTMLDNARMTPATFLDRIATLPARQITTHEYEHIYFEYNRRDPDVMALLIAHCHTINARRLPMRSGKILQISVEDPPEGRSGKHSS